MEDGHAPTDVAFSTQLNCANEASLWAALAHPDLLVSHPYDAKALLREFSALPLHLRHHLGPILSDGLLNAGDTDTAAAIVRIVKRGPQAIDTKTRLTETRIDIVEGKDEDADTRLKAISEEKGEPSAMALATLISRKIARKERVSLETVELISAFAFEHRNSDIAFRLAVARAEALASSGDFDAAFDALEQLQRRYPDATTLEAETTVLEVLTDAADDVTFLKHVFSLPEDEVASLLPAIQNRLADRLIDLGFAPESAPLLAGAADGPDGRARRLLRARVALAARKPRRAEAELLGLQGPAADLIEAKVRVLSEDYNGAFAIYSSLGRPKDAEAAALMAGKWESLRKSETTGIADAAKWLNSDNEVQNGPDTHDDAAAHPLAQGRSLIGQSASTRRALSELLRATQVNAALPAQ